MSYVVNDRLVYCYDYEVESAPSPAYPFENLDIVKQHLNMDTSDTSEDAILTLYAELATLVGEQLTRREFLNKTFKCFADLFQASPIRIQKSRVSEVTSLRYKVDGQWVVFPSENYELTQKDRYGLINIAWNGELWPINYDDNLRVIEITFTAGYGATHSSVPADIKGAILNHIAYMYANRGDCMCTNVGQAQSLLPATSKLVYGQKRINLTRERRY